jgi:hypothetical protein
MILIELVGSTVRLLRRRWYDERDYTDGARFQKQLTGRLRCIFDQLEQLGLQHGLSLGCILQANVDKLRVRYPDGFSTEASIARVDVVQTTVFPQAPRMYVKRPSTVGHDTAAAIDRFAALRGSEDGASWAEALEHYAPGPV